MSFYLEKFHSMFEQKVDRTTIRANNGTLFTHNFQQLKKTIYYLTSMASHS